MVFVTAHDAHPGKISLPIRPDLPIGRNLEPHGSKRPDKVKALLLAPEPDSIVTPDRADKHLVGLEPLSLALPVILVARGKRMVQISENASGSVLSLKGPDMDVYSMRLPPVRVAVQHGLLADADQASVGKRHNAGTAKQVFRVVVDDAGNETGKPSASQGLYRIGRIRMKGRHGQIRW